MKRILSFKTFESNEQSDWKQLFDTWKEKNKDRLLIKFPSGFVKSLEPHTTLDLFKKDLEQQKGWKEEWNSSFKNAWEHAQEQWAEIYQRGI